MKFLLLISLLLTLCTASDYVKRELDKKWVMKVLQGPQQAITVMNRGFQVSVPSTVHLNLEKHRVIPDPFFSDNIKSLEWISSCRVSFSTTFYISENDKALSKIKLIFEGIDTYADIFFNDQHLGSTKNAFLKYEYSIEQYAKIGQNSLRVVFNSTKPYDTEQQRIEHMPFDYAHTRKACYQYSWDWAPYMNTMGIWLPVHLHLYDEIKIDYVWIRNKQITKSKAILDIVLALDKAQDEISLNDNIELKIKQDLVERTFKVTSKFSHCEIVIDQPKLWWPNNIGTPFVYEFTIQLFRNGNSLDQRKLIHGIRTVQLNSEGTNFQIIVNGHPIYCKGANYVPPDMMYPRLINPDFNPKNTFRQLLNDAVESNFNMLRVWGGGQYEIDAFYQMASRKGIMIFQDFMFSDSIYPASDGFLVNVRQQILYQVRRLRNHPCIVLWSGNNEILQGIQSWGWSQDTYKSHYNKIFKQLIPNILNIQSPELPYIQSSPSKGVGNAGFGNGGDVHYWGVWAAGSPFQNYQHAIGGFNSQFGTQSLPVWRSILQFTNEIERNYDAHGLASHQRHSSQFRTLKNYQGQYAHKSVNFELEAYASGLVQAYAIQIAIRSQRLAKPKSFGTLYWQLNDAWPSISWSSIDYYGRWKPLQYLAKRLYKDVVLLYNPTTKKVAAINDKLYPVNGSYVIMGMNFEGKVLYRKQESITLQPNENKEIVTVPSSAITGFQKRGFIYTEIKYGPSEDDKTVLVTFHLPMKKLEIEDTVLNVKFYQNSIQFSSSYLIKSLFIDCQVKVRLSDNYFDLLPGMATTVYVQSDVASLQTIRDKFTFKSYRQVFDPSQLRLKF